MSRVRDESMWEFSHHASVSEFLSENRTFGAHAIPYKGQTLDFLIENRKSRTTLVVFHTSVALKLKTYPVFMGREVTENVGINLISVSDPSISIPGLHLGWHLGNQGTGPLKPVLVELLKHIINSIGSERTILFGASGGGYVAAHLAPEFPGSLAFIVNPRLSLKTMTSYQLEDYFDLCHGKKSVTELNSEYEEFLKPYGPSDLAETVNPGMKHRVAIYQNLGDKGFLNTQVLPFVRKVGDLEGVSLRLNADDFGHKSIPGPLLRQIIRQFDESTEITEGLSLAGFTKPTEAVQSAMEAYPSIMKRIVDLEADRIEQIIKVKRLRRSLKSANEQLERTTENLNQKVNQLNRTEDKMKATEVDLAKAQEALVEVNTTLKESEEYGERLAIENHKLRNPPSKLTKMINSRFSKKLGVIVPTRLKRAIRQTLIERQN